MNIRGSVTKIDQMRGEFMLGRNRTVLRAGVIAMAMSAVVVSGTADAQSIATGHAQEGLVATAGVTNDTARDAWRLNVQFVVPQGLASASNAALPSDVDLARPWAAISIDTTTPGRSCAAIVNPTGYSVGERHSRPGRAAQWAGTYVDLPCADGSGFDFYRVIWNSEKTFLVTNPVALANVGALPAVFQAAGIRTSVEAAPEARQTGEVTLCGHRPNGGFQCFGRDGGGTILHSTTGVHATVVAL